MPEVREDGTTMHATSPPPRHPPLVVKRSSRARGELPSRARSEAKARPLRTLVLAKNRWFFL